MKTKIKFSKSLALLLVLIFIFSPILSIPVPTRASATVNLTHTTSVLGMVGWWTFDGGKAATTTSGVLDSINAKNGSMQGVVSGGGQKDIYITGGKTSWTASSGITTVYVEAWGAGGGGGGNEQASPDGGGGGGAGAYRGGS